VEPLAPPDCHHLNAAQGWLGLGDFVESQAELARISAANTGHFAVLDTRWQWCAAQRQWAEAYLVAESCVRQHPDEAAGWIHLGYAARRCPDGGLELARARLGPAADLFPGEPIVPYNLACYAAQLGKLDEAWTWFETALARGDLKSLRAMALADADLQPLWPRIRAIS